MITWKCTPGFLYQTTYAGKRARQRRDRKIEEECVRDRVLLEVRFSIGKKYTVKENICGRWVGLISEVIKMLLMVLFS
jgi:hypothetical protein